MIYGGTINACTALKFHSPTTCLETHDIRLHMQSACMCRQPQHPFLVFCCGHTSLMALHQAKERQRVVLGRAAFSTTTITCPRVCPAPPLYTGMILAADTFREEKSQSWGFSPLTGAKPQHSMCRESICGRATQSPQASYLASISTQGTLAYQDHPRPSVHSE